MSVLHRRDDATILLSGSSAAVSCTKARRPKRRVSSGQRLLKTRAQ